MSGFSPFFCDKITLLVNSNSNTTADLYLITDTPPLTGQNNFTIESSLTLSDNTYNYWNYYLYPGSNFSTTIRARSNSDNGTVYLFKGKSDFQQWIGNPILNRAVATLPIPYALHSSHLTITSRFQHKRRMSTTLFITTIVVSRVRNRALSFYWMSPSLLVGFGTCSPTPVTPTPILPTKRPKGSFCLLDAKANATP